MGWPSQIQERFVREHWSDSPDSLKGWLPIIVELDEKLSELDPDYKIAQIKEKFGGLRYYVEYSDGHEPEVIEKLWALEGEAEKRSFELCMRCGTDKNVTTASREGGYWILTLCESCRESV